MMKKLILIFMFILFLPSIYGVTTLMTNLTNYATFDSSDFTATVGLDWVEDGGSSLTFPAGKVGVGFETNDVNDGVVLGNCGSLAQQGRRSISLWYKVVLWQNNGADLLMGYTTGFAGLAWRQWSAHELDVILGTRNWRTNNISFTGLGTWHHFVYTFDGGERTNLTSYIDGYRDVQGYIQVDDTVSGNLDGCLRFNRDTGANVGYFIYDEVALWDNRTLSDAEVLELYTADGSPMPAPAPALDFLIHVPLNDTNINKTTTVYYNLTDGGFNITCNLYNNGSIIKTDIYQSLGMKNFSFGAADWTQGYNTLNVTCNNSVGLGNDGQKYIFVDDSEPTINHIQVIQDSDGISFNVSGSIIDENLHMNITVSDNNLYLFNITVYPTLDPSDVEYSDKVTGINTSTYNYNKTINLGLLDETGNFSFYLEVCDAHTRTNIDDMRVSYGDGRITFDDIIINSIDKPSVFTTTKLDDRYTFDLTFDVPQDNFEIEIEDDNIDYLINSDYLGHIIIDKTWLDFENDFYAITESIITPGKIKFKFESDEPHSTVSFNSIGKINCINLTVLAFVESETDTTNASSPNNNAQLNNSDGFSINFSYVPYYGVAPDNCSLFINSTQNVTDVTITKNVLNEFTNIDFGLPLANQTNIYTWQVKCYDEHLHPPLYTEEHVTQSIVRTLILYNNATTTTTTTTTAATTTSTTTTELKQQFMQDQSLTEFRSVNQGMFYIFLILLWVIFLYMTFTVKGSNGNNVGFFNILQLIIGFVAGTNFMIFSYMIGWTILLSAVGIFVGKIMYD